MFTEEKQQTRNAPDYRKEAYMNTAETAIATAQRAAAPHLNRRGFLRAGVVAGLAASVASITKTSGVMASNAPMTGVLPSGNERQVAMATSMNVVLVHGFWADGSSWSKVIPLLQGAGYHTIAVPLDLNSLADDVAKVRVVLDAQSGPTVLVGHSYGGAVISGAGNAPNVKSLVFAAAFAPDEGETLGDLVGRYPALPSTQHYRPDATGHVYIDQDAFPQDFAQDLSPGEAKMLAAVQRPAKASILGEKSGAVAWRRLPTWYQVSAADGIISPDLERFFADRMKAQTTTLAANHASLLSYPTEIAHMIEAAAQASVPA